MRAEEAERNGVEGPLTVWNRWRQGFETALHIFSLLRAKLCFGGGIDGPAEERRHSVADATAPPFDSEVIRPSESYLMHSAKMESFTLRTGACAAIK